MSVADNSLDLTRLRGVGSNLAQKLAKLNIETIHDLIFHLPYKYQDRTKVTPIGQLRPGMEVLFCGQIDAISIAYGRRRSLLAKITDGTGWLTLRWFYFNRKQQQRMKRNMWISGFGVVRIGSKSLEMAHPEYRIFSSKPENLTTNSLTPIYPLTEGISNPN